MKIEIRGNNKKFIETFILVPLMLCVKNTPSCGQDKEVQKQRKQKRGSHRLFPTERPVVFVLIAYEI